MQFPLRDFFWLTIVIGLTIGIAIERKRVQELSGYQGQAEWWEKAARALGEKFEEKTGKPVDFDELKSINILPYPRLPPNAPRDRDLIIGPVRSPEFVGVGYVRDTSERQRSWATGLIDLDMFLLMLVLCGPVLAFVHFRRKKPQPPRIWDPNYPMWKNPGQVRWMTVGIFLLSIFAYTALRSPFTGTLMLTMTVVWTYYYCQFVLGRQPPVPA